MSVPPPPPQPQPQPRPQQPFWQSVGPPGATAPTGRSGFTPPAIVAIIAAAVLGLGSFLPWIEVTTVFGTLSVNGMDGDGKLTAVAGGVGLALFLIGSSTKAAPWHVVGVVASALGGAVAVYDIIDVSNEISDTEFNAFARASVGFGLYMCAIGAIGAVAAGIAAAVSSSRQ